MPTTPIPSQARSQFGFSGSPFGSYFPSSTYGKNQWDIGLAGYSPYDQMAADQQVQEQQQMLAGDFSSPQAVTGLQRLVGQGYMKPQQATAIARIGALSQKRNQASQDAITDLLSAQTPEDYSAVLDKHRSTGAFADPNVVRTAGQVQGRIQRVARPVAPSKKLTDAYSTASVNPTDEAKAKYMKDIYGIQNPSKATSDDWRRAFNDVQSEHLKTLGGMVSAAQASGQTVHPDILNLLQGQQMPQNAPQAAQALQPQQAAPNAPTAPQTQANPYSVQAPNGKVYFFQSPDQAAAFRAKAGL